MNARLTQSRLREMLSYDHDTGHFYWRRDRTGGVRLGDVAGSVCGSGYVQIRLDGGRYKAHRLAWLYVHGAWPTDQIDHINGVRTDNRLLNLRQATRAENSQNRARGSDNTSGHMGVSWAAHINKWIAQIKVNGVGRYLGCFDSIEDAVQARAKAKAELHVFQPFERTPA